MIDKVVSSCNVCLGDDSIAEAIGIGSIIVGIEMRGKTARIYIMNMLHVLKLHTNLVSVSKLLLKGLKVQFDINRCIVGGANGDVVAIV